MTEYTAPLTRAARVGRGAAGAVIASLLAATSHGLAGGTITWLALVATAVVALPLCTILAGRIASLWRLSFAVAAAQFLYHWSFAGLGAQRIVDGSAAAAAEPLPLHAGHAAHLAALAAFSPAAATAGGVTAASDALMWALHAVAALATIALMYRGERAFLALVHLVRHALPIKAVQLSVVARPSASLSGLLDAPLVLLRGLFSPAAITHRGPPTRFAL